MLTGFEALKRSASGPKPHLLLKTIPELFAFYASQEVLRSDKGRMGKTRGKHEVKVTEGDGARESAGKAYK